MKKKVLICGATGFIGRNLTEHFSKRPEFEVHTVRFQHAAYDCGNDVIWHQADLRRQDDVDRVVKGMDIIIQAAASTSSAKDIVAKPYLHVTDNAIMNSYLLRTAFEHKVKHLIFLSSSKIYHPSETPVRETDFDANQAILPPYTGVGNTKLYIEKMCEFYSNISDTKFTTIRHSNVYGPHDKFDPERSQVVGSAITKVMMAKDKVLIVGTGEEKRDLLYIDDLVSFIDAAIQQQPEKCRTYNCGTGVATETNALYNKIIQYAGKSLSVENDLSQATIKSTLSLDCALAQQELGWKAQTDLDTGLRKTISWFRDNVRIKVAEPA